MSRMTSRGVKWSPAVSFANSLKRRMRFSKDRHGQHHSLILRRAIRAAQQVGDLPDGVGVVVVGRH